MKSQGARIAIGLVVASVVLALVKLPFAFGPLAEFEFVANSSLGESLRFFLAMATGAFISKRKFIIPAGLFTAALWLFAVLAAYQTAAAKDQLSLIDIASHNATGLLIHVLAAVAGAFAGSWLYGRFVETNVSDA